MYEDFYKFNTKPFRLSPDPTFVYESRGHKKAMANLRYGIEGGDGFVVITGDIGAGKTTLVATLLDGLKTDTTVQACSLVSTQLESDDLLRAVAESFGIVTDGVGKGTLVSRLEQHCRSRVGSGVRIVLIIDEAQNLSRDALEEIRMLSNFSEGAKPLVQSILVGQKEFLTNLHQPRMEQLQQRVVAAYHLDGLSAEEIPKYIEHRMATAGWKGDPRFDQEASDLIRKYTRGLPRRINTLCERILVYGYVKELHQIGAKTVEAAAREQIGQLKPTVASGVPASKAAVAVPPNHARPEANVVTDVERRLVALEKKVESLTAEVAASNKRVKRMIMMALLSDEDDGESEFFNTLKDIEQVDEK